MSSLPVLVLNSGSSSIKFSVYEAGNGERTEALRGGGRRHRHRPRHVLDQGCPRQKAGGSNAVRAQPRGGIQARFRRAALGDFPAPVAIGHRTVCGGRPSARTNSSRRQLIARDRKLRRPPRRCTRPSPSISLRESLRLFPGIPNFAILDTYFHRTLPRSATHMPFRPSTWPWVCGATAIMASRTSRSSTSSSPTCRRSSSSRTSATARPSRPSATAMP